MKTICTSCWPADWRHNTDPEDANWQHNAAELCVKHSGTDDLTAAVLLLLREVSINNEGAGIAAQNVRLCLWRMHVYEPTPDSFDDGLSEDQRAWLMSALRETLASTIDQDSLLKDLIEQRRSEHDRFTENTCLADPCKRFHCCGCGQHVELDVDDDNLCDECLGTP
jgi:hypothetical protein